MVTRMRTRSQRQPAFQGSFQSLMTESMHASTVGDMLPDTISATEFNAAAKDDARWRPAARSLLARHGVTEEPRRLGGSMLVYGAQGRVRKLFPPVWATAAAAERACLEAPGGWPAFLAE